MWTVNNRMLDSSTYFMNLFFKFHFDFRLWSYCERTISSTTTFFARWICSLLQTFVPSQWFYRRQSQRVTHYTRKWIIVTNQIWGENRTRITRADAFLSSRFGRFGRTSFTNCQVFGSYSLLSRSNKQGERCIIEAHCWDAKTSFHTLFLILNKCVGKSSHWQRIIVGNDTLGDCEHQGTRCRLWVTHDSNYHAKKCVGERRGRQRCRIRSARVSGFRSLLEGSRHRCLTRKHTMFI